MKKTLLTALALAAAGAASSAQAAIVVVNADIAANTNWVATNEYVLQRPIFVKSGAILNIAAGTIVRGQPRSGAVVPGNPAGSPGALIVTQNGFIRVNGTPTSPVIFTTAATDNNGDGIPDTSGGFKETWEAGDTFYDDDPKNLPLAPLDAAGNANVQLWGGVAVLGKAPTNLANKFGVGYGKGLVEGLTVPGFPAADATYGGALPHDNSGLLRYLSIRHGGDELGEGNELNGLTLAGIGDGTTIEGVEVYVNFDDGIEWFGGTAAGKRLHVAFAGDDLFDADQGFTGVNQFLFGVLPYFNENDGGTFGSGSGDKLCELDGDDAAHDTPAFANNVNIRLDITQTIFDTQPSPLSNFAFWNMTLIGSSPDGTLAYAPASAAAANTGCQFRNGGAGFVLNSVILDTGANPAFNVSGGGAPGYTAALNIDNGLAAAVCVSEQNTSGLSNDADLITQGNALALKLPGGSALSASGNLGNGVVNGDPTLPLTGNDSGRLNAALTPRTTPLNPRLNAGANTGLCPQPRSTLAGLDSAATYRGAFQAAGNLWTTGWTVLNTGGILAD